MKDKIRQNIFFQYLTKTFKQIIFYVEKKMKKEKKDNKKIDKNMTIKQLLELDETLADVLMGFGMFCVLCHIADDETVEQAAMAHGIDVDFLLEKLNENLSQSK